MMSDDTTQQDTAITGQPIGDLMPASGQSPELEIHQHIEADGREYWLVIGSLYRASDGTLFGDTVHGRIILKPRKRRDAFQKYYEARLSLSPHHTEDDYPIC